MRLTTLSYWRWIAGPLTVRPSCRMRLSSDYNNFQFHQIYQKLHNFCVRDMGGFYLDIIKDRIYTCAEDSLPRRSAQTALYQIAEAFVRWIAPILSFTAHEIWGFMPGDRRVLCLLLNGIHCSG